MNKIYTSIEQSQKLIELGIAVSTADMCWTNHCYGVTRSSMTISAKTVDEYKSLLDRFNDSASIDVFIPAWSLSTLMELIPKSIISTPNPFSDKYCCRNIEFDIEFYADNPVDAVFEMIVWLKENEKI